MANIITGSICLSDIPRELIKDVTLRSGEKKKYLNIAVIERKEVGKFGHTHFVSCAPPQAERKEGQNYIIGDMRILAPQGEHPTAADINSAPPAQDDDSLPF